MLPLHTSKINTLINMLDPVVHLKNDGVHIAVSLHAEGAVHVGGFIGAGWICTLRWGEVGFCAFHPDTGVSLQQKTSSLN